jgi:hypothetical protein
MITKKILPLFAMLAVFIVVAVPYSSAAGESLVEKQINLQIDSEYQAEHDEVVNIANASAITNPDTWTPSPKGIWLGASTEESLFRFSEVMPDNNQFVLVSSVRFNSTQIMNGASVTVIRSPVSAVGVERMTLYIHRLQDPSWCLSGWSELNPINPVLVADNIQVARIHVNMTDTSITTGDDCWTVEDRTYVKVHAPLYSGVDYLFYWSIHYTTDAQPAIYVTGQDVANDGLALTYAAVGHSTAPDEIYQRAYEWNIDPGISYDMQNGLGNGLYAESVYVHAGDYLRFRVSLPPIVGDYYHTLMLPFSTDDHELNATVQIIQGIDPTVTYSVLWEEDRTEWYDYILACSNETLGTLAGGYIWAQITFNAAARVNFMFIDSPGSIMDQVNNQGIFTLEGVEHTIYARPWASYQKSVGPVTSPSLNPADFPPMMEVQENQPGNYYGTIIGVIMVVVGGALILTGIGAPIGAILAGAGTAMIVADLAKGGNLISKEGKQFIDGILRTPLDVIRNALMAVGEFVISIGEMLWDGLTWFVDAIVEHGSILLGLATVAGGLVIFFYAITSQMKVWMMAWYLSRGKFDAAAAEAEQLRGQVSGAIGRLRGR